MKELKGIRDKLNEKYGSEKAPIICHVHIAETGDELEKIQEAFNIKLKDEVIAYLDSLGVLDEQVIAAHCVALSDKDIDIMKKRDVKVSRNPVSNLKLASGVSPVPNNAPEGHNRFSRNR
jgi:5-methylthioadenosine/S-adenosylhomocysteine deaminase